MFLDAAPDTTHDSTTFCVYRPDSIAKMTSGAIQQGVPTNVLAGSDMDAVPKSPSLTLPCDVKRMFAALRSLYCNRGT